MNGVVNVKLAITIGTMQQESRAIGSRNWYCVTDVDDHFPFLRYIAQSILALLRRYSNMHAQSDAMNRTLLKTLLLFLLHTAGGEDTNCKIQVLPDPATIII